MKILCLESGGQYGWIQVLAHLWVFTELGCIAAAINPAADPVSMVCRCCHQSGGTDVVDLPDVLLPEAQYLDMFDSFGVRFFW